MAGSQVPATSTLQRFVLDALAQRFKAALQHAAVAYTNQTSAVTIVVISFELAGDAAAIPAPGVPAWFWALLDEDAFEAALQRQFGRRKTDLQFYRTPAPMQARTWDFTVRIFS